MVLRLVLHIHGLQALVQLNLLCGVSLVVVVTMCGFGVGSPHSRAAGPCATWVIKKWGSYVVACKAAAQICCTASLIV